MTRVTSIASNCEHKFFLRLRLSSNGVVGEKGTRYVAIEEPRLWANEKVIKFCFLNRTKENKGEFALPSSPDSKLVAKMDYVIKAMREYEKYANIKFELADNLDAAEIRISFQDGELWAVVGTDALLIPSSEATADLGIINPESTDEHADETNTAIALHGVGHMLGLFHEVDSASTAADSSDDSRDGYGLSNFRAYDDASIMKFFEHTLKSGNKITCTINLSLSDNDKAWLNLHYPKSEINRPAGEDTWVFKKSLSQLLGPGADYRKFLQSGNVSERRSLYYAFIHAEWKKTGKDKKRLADAVFEKDMMEALQLALDNLKKGSDAQLDFISPDRALWDTAAAHSAPKLVPSWMSGGKPLDAIQIQSGISDFIRILGRSPSPAVKRFLTHQLEDAQVTPWVGTLRKRKEVLEGQLGSATDEEKPTIETELVSVKGLLVNDRTPEQVKALAEAGLDGLLRYIEKAIPEGSDVTVADVQRLFTLIPIIATSAGVLEPLLGIDDTGVMQVPEGVQQGIIGAVWGGLKAVPWGKVIEVGGTIASAVL